MRSDHVFKKTSRRLGHYIILQNEQGGHEWQCFGDFGGDDFGIMMLAGRVDVDRELDVTWLSSWSSRNSAPEQFKSYADIDAELAELRPWQETRWACSWDDLGTGTLIDCKTGKVADLKTTEALAMIQRIHEHLQAKKRARKTPREKQIVYAAVPGETSYAGGLFIYPPALVADKCQRCGDEFNPSGVDDGDGVISFSRNCPECSKACEEQDKPNDPTNGLEFRAKLVAEAAGKPIMKATQYDLFLHSGEDCAFHPDHDGDVLCHSQVRELRNSGSDLIRVQIPDGVTHEDAVRAVSKILESISRSEFPLNNDPAPDHSYCRDTAITVLKLAEKQLRARAET